MAVKPDLKQKKPVLRLRDIAAVILLTLLFSGLVLAYANRSVLRYVPQQERTLTSVDGQAAEIVRGENGAAELRFRKESGVFVGKLEFSVEEKEEKPCQVYVTVDCLSDGGSELKSYEFEDLNPVLVGTETLRIDLPEVVRIRVSDQPASEASEQQEISFTIGDFRIDNRLQLSSWLILFAACSGLALACLLVFREFFLRQPAAAFLLIGTLMGACMTVSLPRQKVGCDEETHLQAVMELASLPSGQLNVDDMVMYAMGINEYNNPSAQPGAAEEMEELDRELGTRCNFRSGAHTPDFYVMPNRIPAYLPMAFCMKLASHFGADWPGILLAARAGNMLMYLLLMFFAVLLVPQGKYLMLLIGLLPQNIFMAGAVSYDPFVIGCMSLGYAFMLRGKKFLLPMLLFFVLGCLPKAVYAPVLLMGLAVCALADERSLLRKNAKPHRGKAVLLAVVCAGVFLALVAAFILPTVLKPADTGDVRGGAVSELSQVNFILTHPFTYAGILLHQMIAWRRQCWYGPDCMTFMGHIVSGASPMKGYYQAYIGMILAVIVLSHRENLKLLSAGSGKTAGERFREIFERQKLSVFKRIWILLMVILASALVWTAMYVAFTVPGATEIAGVQGRYFIPLMFPLYLVFCGEAAEGRKEAEVFRGTDGQAEADSAARGGLLESIIPLCYYLLELSAFGWMALTLWKFIISEFCL